MKNERVSNLFYVFKIIYPFKHHNLMYLLKKYASILIVIYMCFSISCSSKKQGKSINDLFTVTDTLEIPIDENISAIGNYYNYFDDSNYAKNILVIPSLKNELYFFDIDKKTLKKKIKLEEEGPNGVGAILKVNVIDEQYIFVNSTRSLENYLVDTNGIKKKTFSTTRAMR